MSHARRRLPLSGALVGSVAATICLLLAVSASASTLPTLNITITKSSVTVGGTTQSGGVNVVSSASGVKEASAILFLLKPGVTLAEFEATLKATGHDPNRASKIGSIVFDAEAPSSHPSEVQTYLQPGQYVAIAGEGEKKAKLHTPIFTVTAASSPAALPTPQATIRSIEFGFRGPTTLHDGEVVRFENEGYLVHMDAIIPAKSRSAAQQIDHDLLTGHEKGIEKLIAGEPFGAGPLSHEASEQMTITAKPGWYVQACFMETQDKRDHTRLGMERIIKIVK